MTIVPQFIAQAKAFVGKAHRHCKPPTMGLFACGLEREGQLVGVAIAGRPQARMLQDGRTVEITRLCTDGTKNANSKLYGAICRAAEALGYVRAITYTLQSESGVSLRAAGFREAARLPARMTQSSPARHRFDRDLFGNETRPTGPKIRWERQLIRALPTGPGPRRGE